MLHSYEPVKTWLQNVDDAIKKVQEVKAGDEAVRNKVRDTPQPDSANKPSASSHVSPRKADRANHDSEFQDALMAFDTVAENMSNNSVKLVMEPSS